MRLAVSILFFVLAANFTNIAQAHVSLKEKIGQMLMIGFKGTELHDNDAIVQAILAQRIGGVVLYDYDVPTHSFDHNIKSPDQLKHLTKQLQDYTIQAALKNSNAHFPLLIGIDYEGGKVNRLKESYGFPKTLSAVDIAALSYEEAAQYANAMASTLEQAGINFNFAPVIDVNVNPESPAIGKFGRSFSADPDKVIAYASLFSKAYQEHRILCSYKHFPGHGSATGDTHLGFVDVTQTWKEYELNPYKALLQQSYSCPTVMTAHVVHYGLDSKGLPATISKPILHDLLREKLNFNGVIITDDMQMGAIADHFGLAEAVRMSINAGADILMFSNQLKTPQNPQEIIDMIYADVKSGKIRESRINEAYEHIMKLKQRIKK